MRPLIYLSSTSIDRPNNADTSLFSFPLPSPTPSPRAPEHSPYAIFTPAPNAHEYSEAVNFRPPAYLLNFVKKILRNSTIDPDMDLTSKQAETVDWGGEVDYSGIEWFKDPPPRPEVSYGVQDCSTRPG